MGSAVDFVETRRLICRCVLADVGAPGGFVLDGVRIPIAE